MNDAYDFFQNNVFFMYSFFFECVNSLMQLYFKTADYFFPFFFKLQYKNFFCPLESNDHLADMY